MIINYFNFECDSEINNVGIIISIKNNDTPVTMTLIYSNYDKTQFIFINYKIYGV